MYCISLLKKFVHINYHHVGYVVIDIKKDFIQKVLQETSFGENSISGFITDDGKEVLSEEKEGFRFSDQAF